MIPWTLQKLLYQRCVVFEGASPGFGRQPQLRKTSPSEALLRRCRAYPHVTNGCALFHSSRALFSFWKSCVDPPLSGCTFLDTFLKVASTTASGESRFTTTAGISYLRARIKSKVTKARLASCAEPAGMKSKHEFQRSRESL